jgi:hypothetical protein
MSATPEVASGHERDTADLARFGYQQELKRSLGTFSSFAVAFSYTRAPFRLAGCGPVVNIVGLLYGGGMLVNFAWPRYQSNPTPTKSVHLNFHVGFLNKIPILWTVFVFILVAGILYYVVTGRRKEFARGPRQQTSRSW